MRAALHVISPYRTIRKDYDEKSRRFFGKSYRPPIDLRFNASRALFLDDELRKELEKDYNADVRPLFFQGTFPAFSVILARFMEVRAFL